MPGTQPSNPRKLIGPSIWLLTLLVSSIPDSWTAETSAFVAGGAIITDAELVSWLHVTPRTLTVWRRRLKRAQLLDWTLKPSVGRIYVVSALVNGIFADRNKPLAAQRIEAQSQTADAEPRTPRYLQ
jgi:hypothetical protein